MSQAEDGALWRVRQTFDFPAVRLDNLLHDGQAKAGAFLRGGEVGFENFRAIFKGNARAIVPHFQPGPGHARFARALCSPVNCWARR